MPIVAAAEEPVPRGELEQDDAERKDVASSIERLRLGLFGRHVPEFAAYLRLVVGVDLVHRAGHAEVDELHEAIEPDEDVVGRDVAVHDLAELSVPAAELMRGVQARRRVGDHAYGDLRRNGAALVRFGDERVERVALDPFHRHVEDVLALAHFVDVNDVRVLDAANDLSLVEEHRAELRVVRELGQHGLHRDELLGLHRRRASARNPHARHAPAADAREKLVTSEDRSSLGLEAHVLRELRVGTLERCVRSVFREKTTLPCCSRYRARNTAISATRRVIPHGVVTPRRQS